MRARNVLLPALCVTTAGVLLLASPAAAVGNYLSWTAGGGGNEEVSTAANWDAPPLGSDDYVSFDAGSHAHNDLALDTLIRQIRFTTPGFLFNGNRIQLGSGGILADVNATTNLDINISVDQTWTASLGQTLVNSGTVNVLNGELTIDGPGTIEFANRIDGFGGVGRVVKQGSGTLLLSGGGGTINTTLPGDHGLDVRAGDLVVTGMLAGTDFVVNGGVLRGGNSSNSLLGVVRELLLNSGSLSPGLAAGDVSTIHTWEPLVANAAGILEVDIDGATSDSFDVYKNVTLNSPTLHLNVVNAPLVGTVFPIITTGVGTVTGDLTTRAGTILTSGEFIDNGHRWNLNITESAVSVEYLGAVPAAPTAPALASTGVTTTWLIPVGGAMAVLGILFIAFRRFGSSAPSRR
ncbi:MAG: hypothetical protein ABIW32_03960 [Terrimesophilobacter sp.]